MISAHSVVKASPEQVFCDLEGETVILNLKNGVYYGLDAIGTHIWNLIQEPKRVGDLRDAILSEYDVEPERCENDLLALLQDFAAHGLIEVSNGTDS